MHLYKTTIPLITHFAVTDNKVAANRYKKANGQMLYNQGINRFARAIFIKNMHDYIEDKLKALTEPLNDVLELELIFYLHRNYQNIRMYKGEVRFPKKENVEISFDVDNISSIWKKAIQDSLTHTNIIYDDNAAIIRKTSEEVVFININKQMKIDIILKKYERKV